MTASKPICRLLHDAPGSGAWNMAVDEVLLDSAVRDAVMTLRFYRWSQATLSLGYFQRQVDRQHHAKSLECPIVRRTSGGGAIVHDQELTYSLAVPASSLLMRDVTALYDAAHDSLLDALASWGIRSVRYVSGGGNRCDTPGQRETALPVEPFLCFQRRACGDVLIDRIKIGGSAQRRHKQAVLQHGSVLLGMSAAATELPGIHEITGVTMHENELYAAWHPRLANRLAVRLVPGELSAAELAQARALTISKYSSDAWLSRR